MCMNDNDVQHGTGITLLQIKSLRLIDKFGSQNVPNRHECLDVLLLEKVSGRT